jgi:putative flippase GtrA
VTISPETRANWSAAMRRFGSLAMLSRFVAVGLAATMAYPVLFLSGLSIGLMSAPTASIFAYAISAALSYIGHRYFSFQSKEPHGAALRRFVPLTLLGLAVAGVMPLASSSLGLPNWMAAIATCVAVPVINAVMLSGLVFPPISLKSKTVIAHGDQNFGLARSQTLVHLSPTADLPNGTVNDRSFWTEASVLVIAILPTFALALSLVEPSYILGTGEVWSHSISDRAASYAGYLAFVGGSWSFPVFRLPTQSVPEGMLLANSDSIPLVAIIGRMIRVFTGQTINILGTTYVLFQTLNGVGGILLAKRFGARDAISLAAVGLIFCALPLSLIRYFHISLTAHWLILFALITYLTIISDRKASIWMYGALAALSVIAAMTHIYLWAIVMAIAIAALLRDLEQGWRRGLVIAGSAVIVPTAFAIWALGYFELTRAGENVGYMEFSLNLLSPFYSNLSGFWPSSWSALASAKAQGNGWQFFHQQSPDATGQQFTEGMGYLGFGILLICIAVIKHAELRLLWLLIKRHRWLAIAAVGALMLAITPMVTIGSVVLTRPFLPEPIAGVLGVFRASGRFAWLPTYLAIAVALLLLIRGYSIRGRQAILALAAAVQLVDTQPLRSAIKYDSSHGVPLFNHAAWSPMLKNSQRLVIIPSFECSDEHKGAIKTGFHVMAAILGPIPINSASQSRSTKDCSDERNLLRLPLPDRQVYLFFDNDLPNLDIEAFINRTPRDCVRFHFGTLCTRAKNTRYDLCEDPFTRNNPELCRSATIGRAVDERP